LVIQSLAYELADVLEMTLTEGKSPRLLGEKRFPIDLHGLVVDVKLKSVSAHLTSAHMIILRGPGNLGVLVCAHENSRGLTSTALILDLAKIGEPSGWLEVNQPKSVAVARKLLGDAVKAAFQRTGQSAFKPV
jgi:hypothetical protein